MSRTPDENGLLERGIEMLREPVVMDGDLDARIMGAVAGLPTPARPGALRSAGTWLFQPRPIRVRPAVVLAAAASIVVAAVGLRVRPTAGPSLPAIARTAAAGSAPVQFMLVAPNASRVSLVGDFNDWQAGATPMAGTVADGLWTVTVPLAPGRYRYAFLVDGATWVPDPDAPRTIDDDFGRPNSVLTIGGS
jgi:Carbohydrate-binding module 48 (Isoamylase N-terminal domain)